MISSPHTNCDRYWDAADWVPPYYILDHWCHGDTECMHAKFQALLSACDRGEVSYRRSDNKTFDDPVHELHARRILLISRDSFDQWCVRLEGKSPLPPVTAKPAPAPEPVIRRPTWLDDSNGPATTAVASMTAASSRPSWAEQINSTPKVEFKPSQKSAETLSVPSPRSVALTERELRRLGVPANEIIAAFRVKHDEASNRQWWNERFSNATRYKKVLKARIQKGQASRGDQHFPSWWDPQQLATWLIDEHFMPRERVLLAFERAFPEHGLPE